MACFVVPAVEAVVVTAVAVALKKKEEKLQAPQFDGAQSVDFEEKKITVSKKLGWLAKLLWGGVVLLAFEHLWHGEIVPFPPFLTAMYNPEDTKLMLSEMASVGTAMAVSVTAAWGVVCAVVDTKIKAIKSKAVKE